ncbi:hypothetical protein GLAREA_04433 [Glarea lozoyensis ATCC 20868]|uniref:Uncharacterized protein n=1 Tax=Glarea lozoyensis (strain ATCC 20868 / MF5171) TaxID=1116229 RepID=S3CM95_GLAL2|nr:uncharacterized protein GLAREA_04433 [Glarea lozoyensis ATCC 20868]EPE27642.1 hypothetical protein GLAREA_04433 [Glarea lozoyensis ATCC 20868]
MGQSFSKQSRVQGDQESKQKSLDAGWAASVLASERYQTGKDGRQDQSIERTMCEASSINNSNAKLESDDTDWDDIGVSHRAVTFAMPDMKERLNDSVREFLHGKNPSTASPRDESERTDISIATQRAAGPGNLGEKLRKIEESSAFKDLEDNSKNAWQSLHRVPITSEVLSNSQHPSKYPPLPEPLFPEFDVTQLSTTSPNNERKECQKKSVSFGQMRSVTEEELKTKKDSKNDPPKPTSVQDTKNSVEVPSNSKAASSITPKHEKMLAKKKGKNRSKVPPMPTPSQDTKNATEAVSSSKAASSITPKHEKTSAKENGKNSNKDPPKPTSSQDTKNATEAVSSSKAARSSIPEHEQTLAEMEQYLDDDNSIFYNAMVIMNGTIKAQQKKLEEQEQALENLRTQMNCGGLKMLKGLMYVHEGLRELEKLEEFVFKCECGKECGKLKGWGGPE